MDEIKSIVGITTQQKITLRLGSEMEGMEQMDGPIKAAVCRVQVQLIQL